MKAPQKVINSLLKILRRDISEYLIALELALQILAWAKLSKELNIPHELSLKADSLPSSLENLLTIFKRLVDDKCLQEDRLAFQTRVTDRTKLSDSSLASVLKIACEIAHGGILDNFEISEFFYQELRPEFSTSFVPFEITELIVKLAGELSNKRVYCPYDPLCLLSYAAYKAGADVYVENPIFFSIPSLVNIFTGSKIHFCISDPVRKPGYHVLDKLDQFDVSISFPPMGTKYDSEVLEHDWYNRFPERTTSGSVLMVRHILSQTKDRSIIAVPKNILFSRGAEHSLRKDLIDKRIIRGVINMPPALIPFTSISFAILVIDTQKIMNSICFLDGGNEKFFERDGRNRSRLTKWKDLFNRFQEGTDDEVVRTVSFEEVMANDAHLEVERYVTPLDRKQVSLLLNSATTTNLGDIVEFIRPSTKLKGEGDMAIFEVNLADFPDFGYLKSPERTIKISEKNLTHKELTTFLIPSDIIIAIKGSVGKVAIVPDTVPRAGNGGWVVNQSCLILRAPRKIIPKVLFMYLSSELGQTLLKEITSGATIPLIQLTQLRNLQVIIPSFDEANEISHYFDFQAKIKQKIDCLHQLQYFISKLKWQLDPNFNPSVNLIAETLNFVDNDLEFKIPKVPFF